MEKFEKLVAELKKVSDLKIAFKDESRLMKVLSFLLFFNKKFMENYTTTLGSTVYFPSKQWLNANTDSARRTLCHEMMHILDSKKFGGLAFSFSYISPQILSLLSLFSISGNLWFLLSLLFLAPLPAPLRAMWEIRAYAVTDAVLFEEEKRFSNADWLVDQFVSAGYYFMWPFKNHVLRTIEKNREMIKSGEASKVNSHFDIIMTALRSSKE